MMTTTTTKGTETTNLYARVAKRDGCLLAVVEQGNYLSHEPFDWIAHRMNQHIQDGGQDFEEAIECFAEMFSRRGLRTVKLIGVPLELAEELLTLGTDAQVYAHGWGAWDAAKPYAKN
jgi:hypothetical protein